MATGHKPAGTETRVLEAKVQPARRDKSSLLAGWESIPSTAPRHHRGDSGIQLPPRRATRLREGNYTLPWAP